MKDPHTTAYALNELPEAEREKFESDLARDAELQSDLQAASDVSDALGQIMIVPGEGLEPQTRARLLREIAANQQAFRARRKIIRFAVPASLAAAASIAVLLLVSGGTTTRKPAVAAASVPEAVEKGEVPGERIFVRSDSAKIASGTAEPGRVSNSVPVPQKRVMPWDAKVLGADVGPSKTGGP